MRVSYESTSRDYLVHFLITDDPTASKHTSARVWRCNKKGKNQSTICV